MTFKQRLVDLDACDDAIAWVGDRDEATAWRECERGDWMLWWLRASKAEVMDRQWRHIACDIAQDAVDRYWKGGPEPQRAIDAARAYADEATPENRAAMESARAAASAEAAAWAAAWAAWAAVEASADAAAWAASASAWVSAWAASASAAAEERAGAALVARAEVRARHAEIVRKWVVR